MRQLKSASIFLTTTLLAFGTSWAQPTNNQSPTGENSQQNSTSSTNASQSPDSQNQSQRQPSAQPQARQQERRPTPPQQPQAAETTAPPSTNAPASESAQPNRQPAQSQQPAPQTRPAPRPVIPSSRIAKKSERPKTVQRKSASTTTATNSQAAKVTSAPTIGNNRITSIVQDRVALERTELQRQADTVAEGFSAVEEARNAIGYINSRNLDRANSSLTTSLSKLETVLAEHPDMPLVPVATEVRVMDFVSDPKMVESVTQNARALVTEGRFQAARQLLRNFASEINIETTSLPMTTFPTTVREAGRLLKQGKAEEAKAALIGALNSLVISEKSVPLPVVKAQALVDEVNRGVIDRSMKKTEAQQLLQAATSQLQMAQTMGYGAGPQDLVVLQNSINQIQKSLNQNIDSRRMLARVRNDLETLKRRTL